MRPFHLESTEDPAPGFTAGTIGGGHLHLLEGDPIDEGLTWSSAISFHQQLSGGGGSGLWPVPTTGFLGVKRTAAGTMHQGWVSVRTEASGIAYRSSAFQRVAGAAIRAGETGP